MWACRMLLGSPYHHLSPHSNELPEFPPHTTYLWQQPTDPLRHRREHGRVSIDLVERLHLVALYSSSLFLSTFIPITLLSIRYPKDGFDNLLGRGVDFSGIGSIHPRRRTGRWDPKEIFYIVSYRSHNDHKYIDEYPNDYESQYPENDFAERSEHHKSNRLPTT